MNKITNLFCYRFISVIFLMQVLDSGILPEDNAMCMTVPLNVLSRKGKSAQVRNHLGQVYDVDISMIEDVEKGSWILANANMGLQKIQASEAKELLRIFKEGKNG